MPKGAGLEDRTRSTSGQDTNCVRCPSLAPAEAAEYLNTTRKALARLRGRRTGPEYDRAESGRVTYSVADLDVWRDGAEERKREHSERMSERRRGVSPSPEALERMRAGQQARQARSATEREANRERVKAERRGEVEARRYRGRRSGTIPSYEAIHDRLRTLRGPARNYLCVSCRGPAKHWAYDGGCEHELIEDGMPYTPHLPHYRPLCVRCHSAERGDKADRPSPGLAAIRAAYAHCEALPGHPLIANA